MSRSSLGPESYATDLRILKFSLGDFILYNIHIILTERNMYSNIVFKVYMSNNFQTLS